MKITWHGRACFQIEHEGYSLVIDPYYHRYNGTGYPELHLEANEVLVSHDHTGHNNTGAVKILQSGRQSPFHVEWVEAPHDNSFGKFRGMVRLFAITTEDGFKIVHATDMAVKVYEDLLMDADVFLVSTGSFRSMEANEAAEMAMEHNPRVIVPMHYHHGKISTKAYRTLNDILDYFETPYDPVYYPTNSLEITKEMPLQVACLKDIAE